MQLVSTYSVKIKSYNHVLKETVTAYRHAVTFFIGVALEEWDTIAPFTSSNYRQSAMEQLTIRTKKRPLPKYPFEDANRMFVKFPSYLRRSAIHEAIGKVSSYKSHVANWQNTDKKIRGRTPSVPKAGYVYPALYRDNCFVRTGTYTARIKVYIRNTWDWLEIELKKSDVDYIQRHCTNGKECAPTLQKRGKQWFLDFPFEEKVSLSSVCVEKQTIVAVDLGIHNACTCSVMRADGTVLGRRFLSLPRENDCLNHAVKRIKKAQQHGARRTPRLWARAKGVSDDIAVKTAAFIMDTAKEYHADVIVFEHLDLTGRKKGSKKQRLHHWKAKYVQSIVEGRAHRIGKRISRVNAWGTSRLAYDGSGFVERGTYLQNGVEKYNYSICTFPTGKQYHCDLNATYNIGARYFVREHIKSLTERKRLGILAKVPECAKRSTCTLSTLIKLYTVLVA